MSTSRTEWVAWFVHGRAEHYPAESERGRWVVAQLAIVSVRTCAGPGCYEVLTGRADGRYCSPRCRIAARRVRATSRRETPKPTLGIPTAQTPLAVTNVAPSPGTMPPDIAHTPHGSPARRCAHCDRGIDHLRADARVCSNRCRMALARRAAALAARVDVAQLLDLPMEVGR